MVLTKANEQPSRWILHPDPPILSFLPSAGDFFLRILNTINVKKCLDFSSERTLGKVSLIVLDLQLYLKPRIKVHPPVNLITIKKRWDRLYDLAGNWRAGIYLCACFSVRTSQAVYVSVSYVCVCVTADLMQLSCLTWQRRLHDSHSEDRWQGLTLLRNPLTHTLRHDAQHKNFLGTHWLITQSNNESCIASFPTVCLCICMHVCVCVWILPAMCF